jgi:hypothetical protein
MRPIKFRVAKAKVVRCLVFTQGPSLACDAAR